MVGSEGASWVAGAIPPLQGLPVPATSGGQLNSLQSSNFALNIDVGITDAVKMTSITGYRTWTNTFSIDGDLSPARTQFGNNILDDSFWSEELRVDVEYTRSIRATVGGYYAEEKTTYYTVQDIRYVAVALPTGPLPLFPLQFIGDDPVQTNSKAAFGSLFFNVTDALSLTGGVRYTKDFKSYTYYRYNLDGHTINPFLDPVGAAYGIGYSGPDTKGLFGGGTVTALSGREASFNGNRTDYHVSAEYRFNPAVMAYLSVGTGYKAGGGSPLPFKASQAIGFGPGTLTPHAIGLQTDRFDPRERFNNAIFCKDFTSAPRLPLGFP